ncbi:calcium-binding protein [Roseicyclus mahoneyensis]|uniref:Hemolysin type calcium-binding protein n=1 Tax=Roseicyclus mahoneyensis TaxID=164332 RepID=A0A316GES6_9RHOB|nr:calcium-binding protein [Roseicyclus mahoneyensis]PWK59083.1 hemolysin type calcium-binding protein [Roseicyclus mahoneyensis]
MITLSNPYLRGDEIGERLFGGNFVFSQDKIDGTFPTRAADAGLEIIRFPGGHTTEAFFDPANPDADSVTFVNDLGQTITLDLVPLSDFLEYALEDDLGAIIVVPVQPYLNAWRAADGARPNILTAEDEQAIRGYITTVLQSGVPIHAIEIGNEPCLCGVNDADYGKIVNEMALVVHDAIEDFEAVANLPDGYISPMLSLVTTPYFFTADTNGDGIATFEESLQERFEQLTPEALANVDAITIHRYVSGHYDSIDNFQMPWLRTEQAEALAGRDLELIVTEWNISSMQGGVFRWATATEAERANIDTGLKHAGAVVAMFHEMAVQNVELAAFWAVQHQNDVSFALREGTTTGLRAGGEIFGILSRNVQGMQAIELDRPSRDFDLHAFADPNRQVMFINSRLGETQTLEIDLSGLTGPVDSGWVQILTAFDGQDPRDPNVRTFIEEVPFSRAVADGVLRLTLDPWEVAVVSLNAGTDKIVGDGVQTVIETGNGEDIILGSRASERLDGGLHDDLIRGNGGNDTLLGGDGDDTLRGGAGSDVLEGGRGDDLLDGGALRDRLYGGDGDDTLIGGANHDMFWGGAGRDLFRINDGDQAWREPIHDFNPEDDRIEILFADLTFDDIFLSQEKSAVIINYGVGSLALLDTDLEDLTEDHFGFL